MTQENTKYPQIFPFEEFVAYLQKNNFVVGVHSYLRLQELLNHIEPHCPPDRLRSILCPIFAANFEEQQQFQYLFDNYFAQFETIDAKQFPTADVNFAANQTNKQKTVLVQPRLGWLTIVGLIAIAIFSGLLIGVFWGYTKFDEADKYLKENGMRPNDSILTASYYEGFNYTLQKHKYAIRNVFGRPQPCDGLKANFIYTVFKENNRYRLEIKNTSKGVGNRFWWTIGGKKDLTTRGRNVVNHYIEVPGTYTILLEVVNPAGCKQSEAKDVTIGEPVDTKELKADFSFILKGNKANFADSSVSAGKYIKAWKWNFGDGTTSQERNPSHTFKMPRTYSVCLEIVDAGGSNRRCKDIRVLPNFINKNDVSDLVPDFKNLATVASGQNPHDLRAKADVTKTLAWLLLAAALVIVPWFYLVYRKRKRNFMIQKDKSLSPPYIWQIEINNKYTVYDSLTWSKTTTVLRKREEGERNILDIPATLQNTIASGGFVDFQYKAGQHPVDYLFLIDRASFKDHQAIFYHQLAEKLQKEDIYIDIYFHNHNFLFFWRNFEERPVDLDELISRHPKHRLVIIGDGEGLLDPRTGNLSEHIDNLMTNYRLRALMSTQSTADWGRKEVEIQNHFLVVPATMKGFVALGEKMERRYTNRLADWMDGSDNALPDFMPEPTLDEIKAYLGEDLFRWLAACSIYPELQWEMTIYLGQMLSEQFHALKTRPIEGKYYLLEEKNLLRLIRLPYFRKGEIPEKMRLALINSLNADTQLMVREAIVRVLEDNLPPNGSTVSDKYKMNIVLQKWEMKDKNPETAVAVQTYLERNEIEDYVVLDKLKQKTEVKSAKGWDAAWANMKNSSRSWIFRDGIPLKGVNARIVVFCSSLAFLIVLYIIYQNLPSQKKVFKGKDQKYYYLKNQQDTIDYYTFSGIQNFNDGFYGDAINDWTTALAKNPFNPSLYYNRGLAKWNVYQNDITHSDSSLLDGAIKDFNLAMASQPTFTSETKVVNSFVIPKEKSGLAILDFAGTGLLSAKNKTLYRYTLESKPIGNKGGALIQTLAKESANFNFPSIIKAIAVSSQIGRAVVANQTYSASLIEVDNLQVLANFSDADGHKGALTCAALSDNGNFVATGGTDNKVILWDSYDGGKLIFQMNEHTDRITDLHFSKDNLRFISASNDNKAIITDAQTGRILQYLNHNAPLVYANFSPEGTFVITATNDGIVHIWNNQTQIGYFQTVTNHVLTASLTHDGSAILIGDDKGWVKMYDLQGKEILAFQLADALNTATNKSINAEDVDIFGISLTQKSDLMSVSTNYGTVVYAFDPKTFVSSSAIANIQQIMESEYKGHVMAIDPKTHEIPLGLIKTVLAPYQLGLALIEHKDYEKAVKILNQIPIDSSFKDSTSQKVFFAKSMAMILFANQLGAEEDGQGLFSSGLADLETFVAGVGAATITTEKGRYNIAILLESVLKYLSPSFVDNANLADKTCSIQNLIYYEYCKIKKDYDELGAVGDNGFIPFRKKGYWGYINTKREEIIKPLFISAQPFTNKLALVQFKMETGLVYAYINELGQIIYDFAGEQKEGFTAVQDIKTKKWGYLDENNKVAITPQFDEALPFTNGFAIVMNWDKKNHKKFGYIRKDAKKLTDIIYDEAYPFGKTGIANAKKQGMSVFIDRNGAEVSLTAAGGIKVAPVDEQVTNILIPDEKSTMRSKSISTMGDNVNQKIEYAGNVHEDLRKVRQLDNGNLRYAFVDINDKPITAFSYLDATDFSEGKAGVKNNNNLWGFINKQGILIIPYTYEGILQTFQEGKALVKKAGATYYIDEKGDCKELEGYSCEGKAQTTPTVPINTNQGESNTNNASPAPASPVFKEGNKWGIQGIKGEKLTKAIFDNEPKFASGVAKVSQNGKWAIISPTGRQKMDFEYDEIGTYALGLAPARKGNKWGYLDLNGKEAITFEFDYTSVFENRRAMVTKDGKSYYINPKGVIIANVSPIENPLLYNNQKDKPTIKDKVQDKKSSVKQKLAPKIPQANEKTQPNVQQYNPKG